ncbi:MAG: hypothetical protein ACYDBQ_07415 [Thermoplasmatota archaeon]
MADTRMPTLQTHIARGPRAYQAWVQEHSGAQIVSVVAISITFSFTGPALLVTFRE